MPLNERGRFMAERPPRRGMIRLSFGVQKLEADWSAPLKADTIMRRF